MYICRYEENNVLTVNLSFISLIKVKIKCYDIKIYRNKQMSYLTFKFFIIWEVYWTSTISTLKKVEKPSFSYKFFSSTIDVNSFLVWCALELLTIYFSQMKMSSCKILSNCPVWALVTIDTRIFTLVTHATRAGSEGWIEAGLEKYVFYQKSIDMKTAHNVKYIWRKRNNKVGLFFLLSTLLILCPSFCSPDPDCVCVM